MLFFLTNLAYTQVVKDFTTTKTDITELKKEYGMNKELPAGFEDQALQALTFFPELKKVHIRFFLKKTKTPLASRPTLLSMFRKPENRHYVITISTRSKGILDSILLHNLSYNARVGVLSHELS
ncbi:MAG: hypothetical protein V4658_11265, partial [Bacteroidota bacterium]